MISQNEIVQRERGLAIIRIEACAILKSNVKLILENKQLKAEVKQLKLALAGFKKPAKP